MDEQPELRLDGPPASTAAAAEAGLPADIRFLDRGETYSFALGEGTGVPAQGEGGAG